LVVIGNTHECKVNIRLTINDYYGDNMKQIETECQTTNCKNKVMILADTPYYGILCKECLKGHTWTKR